MNPPAILRDKETKAARFLAPEAGSWKLYAVNKGQGRESAAPVLTGERGGSYELSHCGKGRAYFLFERDGERRLLAERLLPMAGGYNFRDLGGLAGFGGKRVRWGRMLRADGLSALTQGDLDYLASIPVTTVVDFRAKAEADRAPDRLPGKAGSVHIPIMPGRLDTAGEREALLASLGGDRVMEYMARALAEEPGIIAAYKEFFRLVQDERRLPLLFHCSAGKDRTGHAAALFLFALGADKETVMRDYLASAAYLEGKYDSIIAERPDLAPLFTVRPQYLQAAIAAMESRSGSVEAYLAKELDVDLERMRGLFLEDS